MELLALLSLLAVVVLLIIIAINTSTTAKYSRFSAHFLKLMSSKVASEEEVTLTERKAS